MSAIDKLTPGRSTVLSHEGNVRVIAERSGDGRTLRVAREWLDAAGRVNRFVVVRACAWEAR